MARGRVNVGGSFDEFPKFEMTYSGGSTVLYVIDDLMILAWEDKAQAFNIKTKWSANIFKTGKLTRANTYLDRSNYRLHFLKEFKDGSYRVYVWDLNTGKLIPEKEEVWDEDLGERAKILTDKYIATSYKRLDRTTGEVTYSIGDSPATATNEIFLGRSSDGERIVFKNKYDEHLYFYDIYWNEVSKTASWKWHVNPSVVLLENRFISRKNNLYLRYGEDFYSKWNYEMNTGEFEEEFRVTQSYLNSLLPEIDGSAYYLSSSYNGPAYNRPSRLVKLSDDYVGAIAWFSKAGTIEARAFILVIKLSTGKYEGYIPINNITDSITDYKGAGGLVRFNSISWDGKSPLDYKVSFTALGEDLLDYMIKKPLTPEIVGGI